MPATEPERSYRALLRVPSIARVLVGMQVARIAQSMVNVAMVLFALTVYGSAPLAGLVGVALALPGIIFSPVAGALLDRHGRMRLVLLDYLLAAASLGLIAVLAATGRLPAWLLLAIAAVSSLTSPLSTAGLRSLFPVLVPKAALGASQCRRFGRLRPGHGGRPAAGRGDRPALGAGPGPGGDRRGLRRGGGRDDRAARAEIEPELDGPACSGRRVAGPASTPCATGPCAAWASPFGVAEHRVGRQRDRDPPLVLQRLHGGPALVGLLFAAQGLGGVISSTLAGRIDTRGREHAMIVYPMLGSASSYACCCPMPGWSRSWSR